MTPNLMNYLSSDHTYSCPHPIFTDVALLLRLSRSFIFPRHVLTHSLIRYLGKNSGYTCTLSLVLYLYNAKDDSLKTPLL